MTDSDASLESFQQIIGYQFKDIDLLGQAFIHASVADDRRHSNERLEFLGDAVLGMVICTELYERFPRYLEGELTKIKSMIVSRRTCARIADKITLSKWLRVGKGMRTHRTIPSSCSAGALEAIIGAIYVDGGEDAARQFILDSFGELLDEADAEQHQENFKSILQQHVQRVMETTPVYELLDEKGPDHSKCFEIGVAIANRRFSSAWGSSKKEAEQLAAYNALITLGALDADADDVELPPELSA